MSDDIRVLPNKELCQETCRPYTCITKPSYTCAKPRQPGSPDVPETPARYLYPERPFS